MTMEPLSTFPLEKAAAIRAVFTDIDDTVTTDGRLTADAYGALERLKEAGLAVIPITGRPSGWCDMIARFWPVDGVVGENGAFYFAYDRKAKRMHRVFGQDDAMRRRNREKLSHILDRVMAEVDGCKMAADQAFRETDLAIDFAEDVPPLAPDQVDRIKSLCEAEGAVAKISSIHVNVWFGDHDKLSMTRRFASERLGLDIDRDQDHFVFCGDSPNDAPMFAHFPYACGVANVRAFSGRIDAEPAFIAPSEGGRGFVEIADYLLQARM